MKDGRHQPRVGNLEVEQPLRRVQQLAGNAVNLHVPDVLFGVVAADMHVLEAPVGRNLLRVLEARAGVGDEADACNHLVFFHHQMVHAVHPFHSRSPVPELGVNTLGPQVGRLEYVGIRGDDEEIVHTGLHPPPGASAPRRQCVQLMRYFNINRRISGGQLLDSGDT